MLSELEARKGALKVSEEWKASSVLISVVLSIQASAGDQVFPVQERQSKTNALVVGENGIVLAGLADIDKRYQEQGKLIRTNTGNATLNLKLIEFKDAKILLPDGREIRATVVLRDDQLGILCFRADPESLEEEGVELKGVDLDNPAELEVMDYTVYIRRLGADANYALETKLTLMAGMLKRPQALGIASINRTGVGYFSPSGGFFGFGTRIYRNEQPSAYGIVPAASLVDLLSQIDHEESE
jgi:hypothetical protein